MREDSNPRSPQGDAGFQDRDLKPLRHSSQPFLHKTHRCSLLVLSAYAEVVFAYAEVLSARVEVILGKAKAVLHFLLSCFVSGLFLFFF